MGAKLWTSVYPSRSGYRDFGEDSKMYPRWCLGLPPGLHEIDFRFRVAADYFDGASHWRWVDLERHAAAVGAIAWQSEANSNVVQVSRI